MRKALVLALALLALVSCSKADHWVTDLQTQAYVNVDGTMGISIYVLSNASDGDIVQFVVKNPGGNLSWTLAVSSVDYEDALYYGSSALVMPQGSLLEEGTWSLDVIYKDGSTLSRSFEVSYGDAGKAIEAFVSLESDEAWFSEEENLTVVP